jgi:dUTP pyrophosphatase
MSSAARLLVSMERVPLEVQRLDRDLPLPRYQHKGDAGLDLHAAESVVLAPGERAVVGTGIAVAIPTGFVGLAVPRSGFAVRLGLSLVNTPGIVDSGYRGEVRLVLINLDPREPVEINRGDRVAQLVLVPVAAADIVECDELPPSVRGEAGFGSTGGVSNTR